MRATLTILDPVAPAGTAARQHGFTRLDSLKGKVIGFIDNSKPNFNLLVDDLAELLIARHGAKAVVKRRKLAASIPAPAEFIADIQRECDLVVTGSGD
jgi:hypothetical protein